MRYLKTYTKIFEEQQKTISDLFDVDVVKKSDEVIDTIKDILLELTDIGYDVDVDYYPVIRDNLENGSPIIQINISKPTSEDENGFRLNFLPLWRSEDDKIDFDDTILRVLYYAISEGYKYECDLVKSQAESIRGHVVRYIIKLSKPVLNFK